VYESTAMKRQSVLIACLLSPRPAGSINEDNATVLDEKDGTEWAAHVDTVAPMGSRCSPPSARNVNPLKDFPPFLEKFVSPVPIQE